MAFAIPPALLGLWIAGDIGGYTVWTDRYHRLVVSPKSPPKEPPSAPQIAHRARWRAAVKNWHAATPATRQLYERVSRAFSLPMTGHNVWIHLSFHPDSNLLATLERHAMLPLPLPAPPPV